jgi:hypothetical protein
MRTYIGKHLKSRSETIWKALIAYNSAVQALQKPPTKFQDIIKLSFVSEFDLLKDSRNDIREKIWANPQARIVCDAFFRRRGAREELACLSLEIRRLINWMGLQENRLQEAVCTAHKDTLEGGGSGWLGTELIDRLARMHLRHQENWIKLRKLQTLEEYDGPDIQRLYEEWSGRHGHLEITEEEKDDYQELVEERSEQIDSMDLALYGMVRQD